jgi:3-hydroxybutyryl-CoA dehydratase
VQQSLRYFALAAIREQGEHMTRNGNGSAGLGHGYYFEDLSVGMDASYAKRITNEDILAFAELSGDVSQTMKFRGPVYIGDEVVATLKITALDPDKARVTLACDCSVNGKTVLEGEALMMVDRRAPRQ